MAGFPLKHRAGKPGVPISQGPRVKKTRRPPRPGQAVSPVSPGAMQKTFFRLLSTKPVPKSRDS